MKKTIWWPIRFFHHYMYNKFSSIAILLDSWGYNNPFQDSHSKHITASPSKHITASNHGFYHFYSMLANTIKHHIYISNIGFDQNWGVFFKKEHILYEHRKEWVIISRTISKQILIQHLNNFLWWSRSFTNRNGIQVMQINAYIYAIFGYSYFLFTFFSGMR